jgi:midasin
VSNEKAQRQLHRLTRRATQMLREPAAGALMAAAKSMGFTDLQQQQQEEQRSAAPPEGKNQRGGKKAAEAAAALRAAAEGERSLAHPAAAAAAVAAVSRALVHPSDEASTVAPTLAEGKYAAQLPRLTRRFVDVAAAAVGAEAAAAGAASVDELAGEAASRALELRGDVTKGAKSRKKKALTGEPAGALGDPGFVPTSP